MSTGSCNINFHEGGTPLPQSQLEPADLPAQHFPGFRVAVIFITVRQALKSNIYGPGGGEYLWPQVWGIIMALNQPNVGNIFGP